MRINSTKRQNEIYRYIQDVHIKNLIKEEGSRHIILNDAETGKLKVILEKLQVVSKTCTKMLENLSQKKSPLVTGVHTTPLTKIAPSRAGMCTTPLTLSLYCEESQKKIKDYLLDVSRVVSHEDNWLFFPSFFATSLYLNLNRIILRGENKNFDELDALEGVHHKNKN